MFSGNNQEMQSSLQNIVQFYSDAAESYIKENCMRHAEQCLKKARLVALQIHLLPSGQQLLNLNKDAVAKFITKHEKFWEVCSYITLQCACWSTTFLCCV